MERENRLSERAQHNYQILGVIALFYTLIDMLFLTSTDHVAITLPLGIAFFILSRTNQIINKLGGKGLITMIVIGTALLIILLLFYYVF